MGKVLQFCFFMKQEPVDYILLTGDFPAHDLWYQGQSENLAAAESVVNMVQSVFPDVTVLPSVGNHEPFPGNM